MLNTILLLALLAFFQDDVHIAPRGPVKPAPSTAWDAKTPFELKGSRVGAMREEVRKQIEQKLLLDGWTAPERGCDARMGDLSATSECYVIRGRGEYMSWKFVEDRLAFIFYKFPNSDFHATREALISKYGKPTSSEIRSYQNAYGAKFDGALLTWRNAVSEIRLEEYSGKRTDSTVAVIHHQLFDEYQARKPKKKVDI